MTMCAEQAPRRNPHLGTDCPPWCNVSHEDTDDAPGYRPCMGSGGSIGDVWTRAVLAAHHVVPVVAITGVLGDDTVHVELRARYALHLAGLVELLADATPDQHRELATLIRKASADMDGGQP